MSEPIIPYGRWIKPANRNSVLTRILCELKFNGAFFSGGFLLYASWCQFYAVTRQRGAVTGGSKFVLHALRVLAMHMILVNPNRALAITLTLTPY